MKMGDECARMRPAAGAELFVSDIIMDVLADIGDGAYDSEVPASGTVLGCRYTDIRGTWAEATELSFDRDAENAIGWYRTSERDGAVMGERDVKEHVSRFGKTRAYAFMIDPSQSAFAIYTVEDGVAVKVRVLVTEGPDGI